MRVASSGTIASESTCQLAFCAASFSAGPPKSLYSPALARSEIVTIPTVICIIAGHSERSEAESRNPDADRKTDATGPLGFARGDDKNERTIMLCALFCLFQQSHVGNLHLLIDRFAHVVDG